MRSDSVSTRPGRMWRGFFSISFDSIPIRMRGDFPRPLHFARAPYAETTASDAVPVSGYGVEFEDPEIYLDIDPSPALVAPAVHNVLQAMLAVGRLSVTSPAALPRLVRPTKIVYIHLPSSILTSRSR